MADVVLKDKNGNGVDYLNARYLKIPDKSGNKETFMGLSNIGCYYATIDEPSSGVYTFTIKGQWFAGKESYCVYGQIDDSMCKTYGKDQGDGNYQLIIIFTHKTLEVGKTYYASEL